MRVWLKRGLAIAACLWAGAVHATAPLVPPPGFYAEVRKKRGGEFHCDLPAPFKGKLEFPSKFEGSDKARDDLNEKALRIYKKETEPITELEKKFGRLVHEYMQHGEPATLHCALDGLLLWAKARALEQETEDLTGRSMRKWALASLASGYLRLKFSDSQPLRGHRKEATTIEGWFERLAERVLHDYRHQPLAKINNHEYWAAWAVMSTAVAVNRRDLFEWAVAQYRIAALQIDEEGYLPNELKRETRALAYHNYALGPLTMLAAFGKANGLNLVREGDHALERLANRVLQGLDDPAIFKARTGRKQNLDDLSQRSKFAWLEPYCWTVECDHKVRERIEALRPLKTYRLGGDLTALFGAPASRATPRPGGTSGTAIGRVLSDPNPSRS